MNDDFEDEFYHEVPIENTLGRSVLGKRSADEDDDDDDDEGVDGRRKKQKTDGQHVISICRNNSWSITAAT